MYKVETFYNNDEQTSIPDVMYSCRNYHSQVWFIKLVKGKGKDDEIPSAESDPLAALERKQNEIFSRLQCLRDTVKQLSSKYTMSTDMTSSKTAVTSSKSVQGTSSDQSSVPLFSQQKLNLGDVIHDLVVSADPDSPPLSLLVLYKVASEMFKVFATSYVHSSVVSMPQNLREVFQNGGCTNRDGNEVAFTLLWKKVQNGPTLMVNPHKQTVIEGESNIARYIQRLINPDFDKCVVGATRIDEWLDLAEQYIRGNKKENAAVLKSLNSKLGSADWLVGNTLSLADIVMWSVINQSKGQKDSPSNVKNWLQRCDRNPFFDLANGAL